MIDRKYLAFAAAVSFTVGACHDSIPTDSGPERADGLATIESSADARVAQLSPELQRVVAQVDSFNAELAARGSELRLDYPWMFTVGQGVDPFAQLRTGARWIQDEVTYILDTSDYTSDETPGNVESALVSSFDTWDAVPNAGLSSVQIPDPGGNFDVLDGTIIGGACLTVFDITSPNLDLATGNVTPEADIVFGGWLSPEYFSVCLGNPNILGVTWSFSGGDVNGDNYADRQYVEQFYNDGFTWATSGSIYLDGSSPMDIESIVVHEVGHTHGLGHFGGPVNQQPFTLKPNGRVFNPEAVMNPFYLNGEQRELLPTDLAAFLSLYSRN